MKTVAVVGTGIMGSGIANNFLKKGYKVVVWNRSQKKLLDFKSKGVVITKTPKEAALKADIVFEVTANDKSSKSVWLGKKGILSGAKKETILITCATLSVDWIDALAKMCLQQKRTFFDMPMTGGRVGAENGKLILLVGGDESKLINLERDLKAVSEKIIYFGRAGSGIRFKLVLNMLQGIHIVAFGEALKLAKASRLDLKRVGDALAERPGGTTTNIAWRDYQKQPHPINFSVEWLTKDLSYAKKIAKNLNTPLFDRTFNEYKKLVKKNLGQKDWTEPNREI